ncbi:MAG: conserved hypothetical exported protein [Marine Group I thaumarchaeote]|nr:MAG: conserved hypothetical exported protein [Marine Group I thaumarchaeote]
MNKKLRSIGLLAILSLGMVSLASDLTGDVYGQEAQGSPGQQSPKSYGSATDDIVCGASLCSTPEGSEDPVNVGRAQ